MRKITHGHSRVRPRHLQLLRLTFQVVVDSRARPNARTRCRAALRLTAGCVLSRHITPAGASSSASAPAKLPAMVAVGRSCRRSQSSVPSRNSEGGRSAAKEARRLSISAPRACRYIGVNGASGGRGGSEMVVTVPPADIQLAPAPRNRGRRLPPRTPVSPAAATAAPEFEPGRRRRVPCEWCSAAGVRTARACPGSAPTAELRYSGGRPARSPAPGSLRSRRTRRDRSAPRAGQEARAGR